MSDYDTYGKLAVDSVWLSENGVRYHKNDDDTMTVTLKATPTEAGNIDLQLPTTAGTLLSNQSTLPGANLGAGSVATAALADSAVTAVKVDINGASNVAAAADADEVLVYDASGTANGKMALSAIKTYVGAGLPTGNTEANVLVADGAGDFQSVALSGDATIAANGALSLAANSVDTAEIADNAVSSAKIGVAQVTAAKLALSCIDNANKLADNVVPNTKLAGGIAQAKLADGFSTAGTWAAGKLCSVDANLDATGGRHLTLSGDVDLGSTGAVYLGDKSTDGSWRMVRSGNDIIWERRETGSWVQKGSFVA